MHDMDGPQMINPSISSTWSGVIYHNTVHGSSEHGVLNVGIGAVLKNCRFPARVGMVIENGQIICWGRD